MPPSFPTPEGPAQPVGHDGAGSFRGREAGTSHRGTGSGWEARLAFPCSAPASAPGLSHGYSDATSPREGFPLVLRGRVQVLMKTSSSHPSGCRERGQCEADDMGGGHAGPARNVESISVSPDGTGRGRRAGSASSPPSTNPTLTAPAGATERRFQIQNNLIRFHCDRLASCQGTDRSRQWDQGLAPLWNAQEVAVLTGDTCNHQRLGKFFSAIQISQTLDRVLGREPAGLQLPAGK